MTRVLVVDDEPQILRALRWLASTTTCTSRPPEPRHWRWPGDPPDLVILDLGLPDLDGVEVIQGLRGWTKAPIMVLSRPDSLDKVEALDPARMTT